MASGMPIVRARLKKKKILIPYHHEEGDLDFGGNHRRGGDGGVRGLGPWVVGWEANAIAADR